MSVAAVTNPKRLLSAGFMGILATGVGFAIRGDARLFLFFRSIGGYSVRKLEQQP